MSYWGIALTHWGNPFGGQRSPQTIAVGKAAIDKALATGSPTTREKGYIDAVAILFSSNDVTTQRQRVLDYEKAMGRTSVANKADMEARIFWALSVAQAASAAAARSQRTSTTASPWRFSPWGSPAASR